MWIRLLPTAGILSSISQSAYRKVANWILVRAGVEIVGSPLWISPRVFLDISVRGSIKIGNRAVISHYVRVLTHDFSLDRVAEDLGENLDEDLELVRIMPVSIGDRAFVGMGAMVLPGVTIGDGAIVGAGSVVTRNVAARTVVAGNPARELFGTDALFAKRSRDFSYQQRRR